MKKILAVLISAMMLVNIGFTAFADGGEVPSDTASSKSETVKEETSKEETKKEDTAKDETKVNAKKEDTKSDTAKDDVKAEDKTDASSDKETYSDKETASGSDVKSEDNKDTKTEDTTSSKDETDAKSDGEKADTDKKSDGTTESTDKDTSKSDKDTETKENVKETDKNTEKNTEKVTEKDTNSDSEDLSEIIKDALKGVKTDIKTYLKNVKALFKTKAETERKKFLKAIAEIKKALGDISIDTIINGDFVDFDKYDGIKPFTKNGRTLAPIRAVSETFGASVEWNENDQSVTITKGGTVIKMTVGSVEAEVNGEKITLDTAPEFSSERTVVPVRFIAESFGLNVDWDEESGTVIIE